MDKKSWIIICPGVKDSLEGDRVYKDIDWSQIYDEAESMIEKILKETGKGWGGNSENLSVSEFLKSKHKIEIVYEMKKSDYMNIVNKTKEYIAAGDIFQANLSQRVSAYIGDKNPWSLYRILRTINPSPFAAFMDFGNYQIVSSSPERLLRVNNRIIETRPIAGTRPRGRDSKLPASFVSSTAFANSIWIRLYGTAGQEETLTSCP